jgi:hypothetical protein
MSTFLLVHHPAYLYPVRLSFLIFVAGFLIGCKSQKNSTPEVEAVLIDYTGTDGCGWLIELDNPDKNKKKILEPVNLGSFSLTKKNGLKIRLTYKEVSGMASICMMGRVVELTSISPVK